MCLIQVGHGLVAFPPFETVRSDELQDADITVPPKSVYWYFSVYVLSDKSLIRVTSRADWGKNKISVLR